MAIYSIFIREDDPEPRAVPDRFSWFAALLPPVHALTYGLWWGLLGWIAGTAAIVGSAWVIGADAAFWLYLLFALFIGFEAGALRRGQLRRRGFADRGERIAAHEDEAATGYIAHHQ